MIRFMNADKSIVYVKYDPGFSHRPIAVFMASIIAWHHNVSLRNVESPLVKPMRLTMHTIGPSQRLGGHGKKSYEKYEVNICCSLQWEDE